MSRRLVPCPICGQPCSGQDKMCRSCYLEQLTERRKQSETCPRCGDYKHYQSNLCKSCYLASHRKPESYVTQVCPVCGEQFTVHKAQIEAGYGKYCSVPCARSGSPTHPKTRRGVICAQCGVTFEKHLAEIRKTSEDNHFCSPECWYAYNQGENHHGYTGATPERQACYSSKEWKWAAKTVWQRDNAECQRCGVSIDQYDGQFHIHHIISFQVEEYRTEPSNLVLLCEECHRWVHSKDNEEKEWIQSVTLS